jgi:UDP-N-acetylglucosamine 1-carboxyvinyltransferase
MRLIVNGGKKLHGEIRVAGSKNATTPIIAATLLTDTPCVLENVPRIQDVLVILDILKSMGSKIRWLDEHTVEIVNDDINPRAIDQKLFGRIRSSILLVGPLLARFKEITFAIPGGCLIGARPIDAHLAAFKELGADVLHDEKTGQYRLSLSEPRAHTLTLREQSVTATENLLMFGARYPLTIKLAAMEPHVEDLSHFLMELGVRIEGVGTHHLETFPPQKLSPKNVRHRIIPDPIEVGTFVILAAATKSRLKIKPVVSDHLDAVLEKFREMGIIFELQDAELSVIGSASHLVAAKIDTRPYPGIPSDLQPLFGVLATQAQGTSLIFDTLYEGRLKYIDSLQKMGAEATILDPHRALITGPSVLQGTEVQSLDLRAGATLLIAALIAKGESILGEAEQIDRGYELIDERLRNLGADIERVN